MTGEAMVIISGLDTGKNGYRYGVMGFIPTEPTFKIFIIRAGFSLFHLMFI